MQMLNSFLVPAKTSKPACRQQQQPAHECEAKQDDQDSHLPEGRSC